MAKAGLEPSQHLYLMPLIYNIYIFTIFIYIHVYIYIYIILFSKFFIIRLYHIRSYYVLYPLPNHVVGHII